MQELSKRERQIMDVLFMLGEATAAEVRDNLAEEVSDASVRKLIRVLEQKGHLTHRREGRSHVYSPKVSREKAKRQAMTHLLRTFFQGSATKAVSTLLDVSDDKLSDDEIEELSAMIDEAKKKGR